MPGTDFAMRSKSETLRSLALVVTEIEFSKGNSFKWAELTRADRFQ